MQDIIAERRLFFCPKGEAERKVLTIRVARPQWVESGVAVCSLTYDGMSECDLNVHGADLLQALHLAADIEPTLRALSKKYDFFFETGEPYFDTDHQHQ